MSIKNLFQENDKLSMDVFCHDLTASNLITSESMNTVNLVATDIATVQIATDIIVDNVASSIAVQSPLVFDKASYNQNYGVSTNVAVTTFSGILNFTNVPSINSGTTIPAGIQFPGLTPSSLVLLQLGNPTTTLLKFVTLQMSSVASGLALFDIAVAGAITFTDGTMSIAYLIF